MITTLITMTKYDDAQTALQIVYNFTMSGEAARLDELKTVLYRDRITKLDDLGFDRTSNCGPYPDEHSVMDEYEIAKGIALENMITESGLERQKFIMGLHWLAGRQLLNDTPIAMRMLSQFPTLSPEGEDLIDFGIPVEEWYFESYRFKHYGSVVQ